MVYFYLFTTACKVFTTTPHTTSMNALSALCLGSGDQEGLGELCGGRWREGNILFYHFSALQEEEFGSRRKSPSYDPQEFTL